MSEMLDEIRINSKYTQLTESLYEETLKDPSIPRIRKQNVGTKTYLKKIANRFTKENILMPPNCRYLEKLDNGGHLVVIEEPPALRTIKTDFTRITREYEKLKNKGKIQEWGIDESLYREESIVYPVSFTLALPYVIFIKMFDSHNNIMSGQIFFRVARLSGLADYLLVAPFTNISDDQYICYGDRNISNRSLDTALADIIMKFWSSKFNSDYTYNYNTYKKVPYVNSLIEWQYHSQTNPMFIYNVDWIKYYCNLNQMIEKSKADFGFSSAINLGYKELTNIFVQPADTGRKQKIGLRKLKEVSLFYDVAQGMYLDNEFFIHVGDSIKIKNGKRAFVDSFIGIANSGVINYIQFKTEDGQPFLMKHPDTGTSLPYLLKAFKEERYEEKGNLANGVEIKEGDIIIVDIPKTGSDPGKSVYKSVQYIRKSHDGIIEAKLGNDFYILKNITGKILDTKKPEFDKVKLKKGVNYILMTKTSKVPRHRGYQVTFDGLTTDPNGNILFSFTDVNRKDRNPIKVSYDPESGRAKNVAYKVYDIKDIKIMPPIFRIGRTLTLIRDESDRMSCKSGLSWGTMEGVITEFNSRMVKPDIDQISQHCLLDNGARLKIESSDFDIEFCIGDKVVSADWENPVNTLIIKTIQGFKVDKHLDTIDFILADKNNNLTPITYVDTREYATVFAGKIRHIASKYDKTSAGTKIMAKDGYIPNFPKKDVNIIIGFITDTGGPDPLVLCSNGCTLWYSEMIQNFDKITMKSSKWKTLPHVPIDVQKIKFQPGDIINCKGDYKTKSGWLVWSLGTSGMYKITNINSMHKYADCYHLDTYITSQALLDCIPNPRLPKKDLSEKGVIRAIPSFHGLFMQSEFVDFSFINDERSILYVQDPHK